MLPYTRPVIASNQLISILQKREELAQASVERLAQLFNGTVYIAKRERHVLYQILRDLDWSNRVILVPDYTCPSIVEAIERSGNYAVTYHLERPFTIDVSHFVKCLREKPDAILVSHVYGEPMPVREIVLEYFGCESKRPLLISDLAHARWIDTSDPRVTGYDVSLYSLAYYKPMAFPDLGVGIVRDRFRAHHYGVYLDNSLTLLILELVKFYARFLILGSPLLSLVYRVTRGKDTTQLWPAPVSRISTLNVAFLSQVMSATESDFSWQFTRYDEGLRNISGIQPLPINSNFATYYPVTVEPQNRDALRLFCVNRGVFLGSVFSHIVSDPGSSCLYSDWLAARILNLPLGPHVTQEGIDYTIELIRKYLSIKNH
jgi:hypothetical protein